MNFIRQWMSELGVGTEEIFESLVGI